jgi:DNA-directed RNA polymerase subunit F
LLILLFQLQNSPGAKAAGVASFISIMIKDCYPAAMQHAFAAGLKEIESKAQDYNENFLNLSPDQKQKLVEDLRTETIEKNNPILSLL